MDFFNNGQLFCGLFLHIGQITPSLPDDIRYLLAHRDSYSGPGKVLSGQVVLDSLGGDVTAALEVGRIIREQKLPAVISTGDKCVSACVFILTGATRRKIRGAVGIHRPYFGGSIEIEDAAPAYRALLDEIRKYLSEMGVKEALLSEMLRIDPPDVRYLSRAELDAFGLGEGLPSDDIETVTSMKEVIATKTARAYGISNQEYYRRISLIDKTCKLGPYQSPYEPPDFSQYGRDVEELRLSARELLRRDLEREETNWSHCFKTIMTHGQ